MRPLISLLFACAVIWDAEFQGSYCPVKAAASPSCLWSATASAPWIRILSGGSNVGPSDFLALTLPNPSLTSRQGTLNIGGLTIPVTQPGHPLELTPANTIVSAVPQ